MRKQLVITLALATTCSTPAAAASLDVNLDFAALNQNQWAPGPAINENAEYSFPDPHFSANVKLDKVELDPVGTLLGFIGDFLGIPLVTGVSIAPTAAITTGFDAGYHINSGSIDLAYPTQVILSLPDQVNYGETFTVSAQPFSGATSASPYRSVDLAGLLGPEAADKLSQFSIVDSVPGQLTPQAGFTTRFPYAEANLSFHLDASAQLNAEVCIPLVGCDSADPLKLAGIDKDVQLLELNSINGLKVLDQDVVSFDQRFDLPGGIGSLTVHSPDGLGVNGTPISGSGGTLGGHAAQDVLGLGFDVDQLLPIVGAVLHNSIGPFAYDLASIEPTLSLGISQTSSFDPTVMVGLHFSDPVIDTRTDTVTRDVTFAVGDSVALMPASIGSSSLLDDLEITPTFSLANTFTNLTQLTLAATLDVQALALTAPVPLGPACCDPLVLDRYVLGSIGPSDPFQIDVPSITTGTRSVDRGVSAQAGGVGALEAWYEAAQAGIRALAVSTPDDSGRAQYQLWAGDAYIDTVSGRLLTTPIAPGADGDSCLSRLDVCDILLLADQDIEFIDHANPNNVLDLGRLLCILCVDQSVPAASLSLLDDEGNPLFFSDVRDFPRIPTAQQILDPSSPFYDERMATSQYFDREVITPAEAPRRTPEPATLVLFGSGFVVGAAVRQRQQRH